VRQAQEDVPLNQRRALHTKEAAQYSGLGKTKLYELAQAGIIESMNVYGRRIFIRESIDKLLTPQP
jgi:excisionase family DNA binding protein